MAQDGYIDEYGNYVPPEDDGYPTAPTYPEPEPPTSAASNELTEADKRAALDFFRSYMSTRPYLQGDSTEGYPADPNSPVEEYVAMRRAGQDHNNAINSAISRLHWDNPSYWPAAGGATDPAPVPDGGGGTGGGTEPTLTEEEGGGFLIGDGSGGAGGAAGGPGTFAFPEFRPPQFTPVDPFRAPTLDEARNEPGYAFAMDQGRKALENSAAAKGILRTGGTLKDLFSWGNQFGEQNYANVYNRAANTWGMNNKQNMDTYDIRYRGEKDQFGGKFDAARAVFDDMYRRWRDILDANTRVAQPGPQL